MVMKTYSGVMRDAKLWGRQSHFGDCPEVGSLGSDIHLLMNALENKMIIKNLNILIDFSSR